MSLRIGRVGLDIDLASPNRWDLDGDDATIDVYLHAGVDESALLALQLAGLMDPKGDRQVAVVWDAWPAVDGWYEDLDLTVRMMGSSLAHGLWRLSGKMRRVTAGTRFESMLYHGRRPSTAVSAGNADPLVGLPPATTTYRRGAVGLGSLAERVISPDSGGGSVLVDVWADTDAQANAYLTVPPADANDGAARLRVGPPLQLPAVDATEDAVLLLHASSLEAGVDGPWENRGTGGSALDAEATVVRGATVGPTDPPVFAAHTNTNATTAFITPTSAALAISGDMGMRTKVRGVGDLLDSGTEFHSMAAAKIKSAVLGPGYDEPDYGITIGIEPGFQPYEMCALWTDTSDVQHAVSGGPQLDPLEWNEYGWDLDVDDGAGNHVVTFYLGDGNGNYEQVDQVTVAGTTDIRDEGGPFICAFFTTLVEYVEVYDAGVLVGSFRAEDSGVGDTNVPLGPADSWTSDATGEVYTLGADSAVFERPNNARALVGGLCRWHVPDNALLDIGTSDWTILLDVIAPSADQNNQSWQFIHKRSGTLGAGGTGWQVMSLRIDSQSLLGEGWVMSDGSDVSARVTSAGDARQILAITLDRSATSDLYVDGDEVSSASVTAIGDMSTSTDLTIGLVGAPPFLLRSHAQWNRALSEEEVRGSGLVLRGETAAGTTEEQIAAYTTLVGRQVPGDLTGWILDNGLFRAYPWIEPVGGDPVLMVETYDGTDWASGQFLQIVAGSQATSLVRAPTVITNCLHEVTLQIQTSDFGSLALQARRGDRWIHGYLQQTGAADIEVAVGTDSVSTTAISSSDAMRATDDDADGNQWLLATAIGTLNPDASGPFSLPTAQALASAAMDFGFAVELGAGIDTATLLAAQYAAYVDETVRLRGAA